VVCHHRTRANVRLLGPCYKTGESSPLRQRPPRRKPAPRRDTPQPVHSVAALHPTAARRARRRPARPARRPPRSPHHASGRPAIPHAVARMLPPARLSPGTQTHADSATVRDSALRAATPRPGLTPRVPEPCFAPRSRRPQPSQNSSPSILTISGPFNSLSKVLFIFPSRYWFTIGHQVVFSLGRWSSPIPTGLHESRSTWDTASSLLRFRLQGSHLL